MPIPDFVIELRRLIGDRPLWLSGVTAVIFDGDRVLLIRRAEDGEWSPVTGIIDPGEEPADTAIRESMEEAGVAIEVERLCSVGVTDPVTYRNGDQAQYIDHTFRCRYVSGTPIVGDDEVTEVGWFQTDTLPGMPPHFRQRILVATAETGPAEFRVGSPRARPAGEAT